MNARFPELEQLLFQWFTATQQAGLVILPSMIKKKALTIARSMKIEDDDFKASKGWIQNFQKRFNIEAMLLHEEGGEVNRNNPVLLQQLQELMSIIDEYEYKNVYNMDEMGLFCQLISWYSLLLPTEDATTVRENKIKKEQITLAVCSNADGSHKIDLQIIGKAKTPACIHGKQWPIPYYYQRNTWMDTVTFMKWFDDIF